MKFLFKNPIKMRPKNSQDVSSPSRNVSKHEVSQKHRKKNPATHKSRVFINLYMIILS